MLIDFAPSARSLTRYASPFVRKLYRTQIDNYRTVDSTTVAS